MSKLSTPGLQVYALSNRLRITHSCKSSFRLRERCCGHSCKGAVVPSLVDPAVSYGIAAVFPSSQAAFVTMTGNYPGSELERPVSSVAPSTHSQLNSGSGWDLLPQTPASTLSANEKVLASCFVPRRTISVPIALHETFPEYSPWVRNQLMFCCTEHKERCC